LARNLRDDARRHHGAEEHRQSHAGPISVVVSAVSGLRDGAVVSRRQLSFTAFFAAVRCNQRCGLYGSSVKGLHGLLDGTEVDEEAFSCLAESVESGTHTFTVCNGEWISVLEWSLKITQAETSLGDKDAALVGLIPLVVSYFKDDLSQLVHEASTEMTGNFLDTLSVCPVIVALGQSIFQCTCHLFVDRELIIPNICLKLAIEYLFAVHNFLNIKYDAHVGATRISSEIPCRHIRRGGHTAAN
ncbi:uncharacterized protein, partial [Dermacentor albipictus]|uniref:uncharacterized protein n=1 Tax=Dermacentor albipictus TaxID=60249 RepID=UPI0038FBF1B3